MTAIQSTMQSNDNKTHKDTINYDACLSLGNKVMLLCGIATIISLLASFAFDTYVPLQLQVVAHIATILFSALFKLGYVIRCIGAHALGHERF